jgi:hypothetical protein
MYIYYSQVAGIPESSRVEPICNFNRPLTLAAVMSDDTLVVGQSRISHPSDAADGEDSFVEKSVTGGIIKGGMKIKRIYYVDEHSNSIDPPVNPQVLEVIRGASIVIYAIGSLYTSIIPSFLPTGVGKEIADKKNDIKIFALNGSLDRETSALESASSFIEAAVEALNSRLDAAREPRDFMSHIIVPQLSPICVDEERLHLMGISVARVACREVAPGAVQYDERAFVLAVQELYFQHILKRPASGLLRKG